MGNTVERMVRAGVSAGVQGVNQVSAALRRRRDPHPYLEGIHAPLTGEFTLTELPVSGTLPGGLDGRYLRIGPNPLKPPNPAVHHWFTGDGMVHGVRIRDGRALWYRNRWIRSDAVAAGLEVAPVPAPPRRTRGTVNTHVIGHAGRTWALVEAGTAPVVLSADLDTQAYDAFADTLAGPYSAHPHRDPATGELHAICMTPKSPTRSGTRSSTSTGGWCAKNRSQCRTVPASMIARSHHATCWCSICRSRSR